MESRQVIETISYRRGELPYVADQLLRHYSSSYRVWLLDAPMGGGKTTLVNALCAQLGTEDVSASPTFAIVNEYHSPREGSVYHMDCYRLDELADGYRIGLDEYLDSGALCFVEWPGVLYGMLPDEVLLVRIEPAPSGDDEERLLTVSVGASDLIYDVK